MTPTNVTAKLLFINLLWEVCWLILPHSRGENESLGCDQGAKPRRIEQRQKQQGRQR